MEGRLTGWTRIREGREPAAYTANGERVLKLDANGTPVETAKPAYSTKMVETNDGPAPAIVED